MSRKLLVPIGILFLGVLSVSVLAMLKPEIEPKTPEDATPLVEIEIVRPAEYSLTVAAQGTVTPRTETDLIPQVSGEVVWVSPALVRGGFFEAGEPLVRIDPVDYEADLESARASLARSASEERRALRDRDRQRRLKDRSVASESRIDEAETKFRVAAARLRESRSGLGRAQRNLERTTLSAPWAGRVRSERADIGLFASRGTPLATLYAVDYAEVPLPLPDRELQFLDIQLGYREAPSHDATAGPEPLGPAVTLRAEFAGRQHEWTGFIVRSEGEIDPRTRMVTLVARVENPYGRGATLDRPPLAVGLFVEAEIRGRTIPETVTLPRGALQPGDAVLVLDSDDRVHFRDVDVLRRSGRQVVISSGLAEGERVCVSPLRGAVDGMRVRIVEDSQALAKVRP